jgi:BirA family biotin operon repressor/biotin-[acetyl-CoA-carboxylase] ligase
VLLRNLWEPARLPLVAVVAGLAVRDAVAAAAPGVESAIKWPNDVLLGGRKVAGVLVEAMTQGARVEAVVVGVGINVFSRSFPEEIADRATSIVLASPEGPPPDRADILAAVLEGLDRDLHVVSARGLGLLRARLERADALRGRLVRTDSGQRGLARGIDDEGRLLVRGDDGAEMAWRAGEVHLV